MCNLIEVFYIPWQCAKITQCTPIYKLVPARFYDCRQTEIAYPAKYNIMIIIIITQTDFDLQIDFFLFKLQYFKQIVFPPI